MTYPRKQDSLLLLFFTVLSFVAMGYHPGLEDDSVYLAAVKSQLNPSLFPHDSIFVRIQMRATLFDNGVAALVRLSHLPLAWVELLLHIACIAAILYCCLRIARILFDERNASWGGVAMLGAMFTLPCSGTALFILDQHLHPRSVATALILFAVWRILARKWLQAALTLICSLFLHPIMTLFGISFCIFLAAVTVKPVAERLRRMRGAALGAGAAIFLPMGSFFQPQSALWYKAISAKDYLFLDRWEWYEWLGAIAPPLLFLLLFWLAKRSDRTFLARFALAVFLFSAFQVAFAIFVWRTPALIRLTPMQPMRFLHLVYLFMALAAGCLLGQYLLKSSPWRWASFLLIFYGGMFAAQRYQFPASDHIEFPGRQTGNPWLQAFAWIRANTPTDAYFALDPYYLDAPGEDYHGFRALAERSQLADAVKDTAIVGLFPTLAPVWARQTQAQDGWPHFWLADFERLKSQFGVGWALVSYPAPAGLACHWHNDAVSVCEIP